MKFNKNLFFISSLAISTIVASPSISSASTTEDKQLFQLNSLENDSWKHKSDQEIYDWLYENNITTVRDLSSHSIIPFSLGFFAEMAQATRLLPLSENTYYFTDELGFYAPYSYVLRQAYEKNNYKEPNPSYITQKGLAIMLRELFPQYRSLPDAEVLAQTAVISHPSNYKEGGEIDRHEAGKAIYYGLHTLDSKLLPTTETLITKPHFEEKTVQKMENKIDTQSIKDFKDLSSKNPYYTIIQNMRNRGIINGYEDGTFRPNENISRQHASAMILRYSPMLSKYTSETANFNDISPDNTYYESIVEMQRHKVFTVDENNNIYPTKAITRGEVASAIVYLLNLAPIKTNTPAFKDVRGNSHIRTIEAAYQAGILKGYEDGTFKPDAPISRQHFAVMMSRAIEYKENKMLHFDEGTSLFNYSNTDLPNINQVVDFGMTEDEYVLQIANDFELAQQQVIAAYVSGSSSSIYLGNSSKDIMDFFNSPFLTREQATQILNYIYYTGKTIIIDNIAYQYNHSKKMLYQTSGNDLKWYFKDQQK